MPAGAPSKDKRQSVFEKMQDLRKRMKKKPIGKRPSKIKPPTRKLPELKKPRKPIGGPMRPVKPKRPIGNPTKPVEPRKLYSPMGTGQGFRKPKFNRKRKPASS